MCRNNRGASGPFTTKMRDITDGTSNTLFVGEALPGRCSHSTWYFFNHTTATCAIPLNYYQKNLTIPASDWPTNYSFASAHTGGGQFLMGDGAVKFISENIDLQLYRNAATISGGEVLGELRFCLQMENLAEAQVTQNSPAYSSVCHAVLFS